MQDTQAKPLVLRLLAIVVAIILILLAAFFVASIGWFLWQAVNALFGLSVDSYIKIVAALGAIGSLFAVIWSKHWERKQSIEQELRRQKTEVYKKLINFWFEFLSSEHAGDGVVEPRQIVKFVRELTPEMISWGADDVIKAWSDLKNPKPEPVPERAALVPLLSFEKLLFAIRRDLGHKNRQLKTGDLLSVFVTDVTENLRRIGIRQ